MEIWDWSWSFGFYAASYAFWILSAVIVVIHILLNMRDDSERALLWIVIVTVLPVIGMVLYLFTGMGRRNYLSHRVEHASDLFLKPGSDAALKVLAGHNRQSAAFMAPEFVEKDCSVNFRVMLDRSFPDLPPLLGNSVELLQNGDAAYPRMIESIRSAKSHIHLQSFIIAHDNIAEAFFDALYERARAGIEVRVIYDNFGSFGAIATHFFDRYAHKSPAFQIHAFSRFNLLMPWRFQMRNHRKLLIVDGATAFLGGINISADNFRLFHHHAPPAIHDLHCCVRGPAVGELQHSFLRDWCYSARISPDTLLNPGFFPPPRPCGNNFVRVIPSGNGHTEQGSEKAFYCAAATAKRYLWINTPYFVPDRAFIKALRVAALRGVDVRIIVPEHNNHWYMKMASRSLYESLMNDGVRIFERGGNFSHAKAMLTDGEWTLFGSSNCDIRSFRLNYELDIVVSGGSFLELLRNQFQKEFARSREVNFTELDRRSAPLRVLQSFCALFTPVM